MKVAGRWCYLYRAIDRDGLLIDSMLSEHRDKHAARRFLGRLIDVAERKPARVTTDHHPAYPRAIRWIAGRKAVHRRERYLNNFTEQATGRSSSATTRCGASGTSRPRLASVPPSTS